MGAGATGAGALASAGAGVAITGGAGLSATTGAGATGAAATGAGSGTGCATAGLGSGALATGAAGCGGGTGGAAAAGCGTGRAGVGWETGGVTDGLGGAAGACCTGAGGVGPDGRRFTVSTTTVLVRPCEKLWRTVSGTFEGRFSVSVLVGVTVSVSPGFFVSLIPCQILRVAPVYSKVPMTPSCDGPTSCVEGSLSACGGPSGMVWSAPKPARHHARK